MLDVIFEREDESAADSGEVRISTGGESNETKLRDEAESKLGVSESSETGSEMEKIRKQNKEIISILEEIRSEVLEDSSSSTSSGGAPTDQLL